jgi:RNA polymerase sigma-70 factor, ECF subfamily
VIPASDLIEAAAAGDRAAAADLIDLHAAGVYGVCLALLADPDLAQDAAQDTLLKAMDRLGSVRDASRFKAWLMSIARNLCKDYWKQARRRRELLDRHLQESVEVVTAGGDAVADTGPDMDDTDLAAALARLPETHRLPLHLYYFDGLDTNRVAEALGISRGGAGSRLCRARRALREILEASDER